MANASKPNSGALLRRGIGYALLALGAGCAAHAPQTQFPLANAGRPIKNSQGVCVQIGPTPAGGKIACYQLAQPSLRHHVEPLRLDEFGYLFPPLKPEAKLASASAPEAAAKVAPLRAAPAIPVAVVPVIPAPTPTVAASTASIALTPPPTGTLPATTAIRYITKTVHFSTRLPFKLNRAHLARQNRAVLLAFVNSLEQYRGVESIRITGHTDRSGPARFNNWLSGMRAKSVQLWLLSLGVDPRITHVRGVGSSEPRAHARSAADNRYVDIKVVVRIPAP